MFYLKRISAHFLFWYFRKFERKSNVKIDIFEGLHVSFTLRKRFQYLELFWYAYSRIRTEHRKIQSISPYPVQMRENAVQNNSEYGNFSYSVTYCQ